MEILARIKQVLDSEAAAIARVRVTQNFRDAVDALLSCDGKLLTTGMGKAGHVARKFAATLCSTGTPSFYLHPGEAAHGDLGAIGRGDCLVAFSTSGKTREVIETLRGARRLGLTRVIGITSHADSQLRRESDIILDMGEVREPCPLGLAPTASIAVMLAISDALALALMECKEVTRQDFGLRHHGGYLGKKARSTDSQ